MKTWWEQWKKSVSIIGSVAMIITMAFAFNQYYAKASEVRVLAVRTNNHILLDQINGWTVLLENKRDRWNCYSEEKCRREMPPDIFKEYKELMQHIQGLKDQMKGIK